MAIHKITAEEQSSDDLLWANEYVDTIGEAGDASRVVQLKNGQKGFLVLCQDFKGFLFKGSKTYDAIQAAIPVWKENAKLPFAVIAIVQQNGKIQIAVDDEFECTCVVDKKGNVDFKYEATRSQSDQEMSNPFLQGLNSPLTTESRARKESSTPTRQRKAPF